MTLTAWDIIISVAVLSFTTVAVLVGFGPAKDLLRRQEHQIDQTLNERLLLDIPPRLIMSAWGVAVVILCMCGWLIIGPKVGIVAGLLAGGLTPWALMRILQIRRLNKLESQLVLGIQTLASGVRAGLNLVQGLGMIAKDGPVPLKQEFSHMLREYEYGVPLEEAMDKCATRVGSGDFRLLFAALQTHRERGGDLGETLDHIADAIREIQRLENRVKTLTAQGRANSRMLGILVAVVMIIFYLVDPDGVMLLFSAPVGNAILIAIGLLVIMGFLWIRKIVSIDI